MNKKFIAVALVAFLSLNLSTSCSYFSAKKEVTTTNANPVAEAPTANKAEECKEKKCKNKKCKKEKKAKTESKTESKK